MYDVFLCCKVTEIFIGDRGIGRQYKYEAEFIYRERGETKWTVKKRLNVRMSYNVVEKLIARNLR